MAREVFRASFDGEIDTHFMRREEERRGPCVIHEQSCAMGAGDFGDGGDILHLKTLRAGGLRENGSGVRAHQGFDAAADHRIEIGSFDTEAFQQGFGECAGGAVNAVGDQEMVARFEAGKKCNADGGEARGDADRALGPGDCGPGGFERIARRCAHCAINIAPRTVEQFFHGGGDDGGAAINRGVDEAELLGGIATGINEFRAVGETGKRLRRHFFHF